MIKTPREQIEHCLREMKTELTVEELRAMARQANDLIPTSTPRLRTSWAYVCAILLQLSDELEAEHKIQN